MSVIQEFDLNMIPDSAPVVIHCDQYDHGTGRLVAHLYKGSVPYTSDGTVVIQGRKPDGRGFDYNATISGGTVTADLTEQMTAVEGNVAAQFIVTDTQGRMGSFAFTIAVQKSALPADTDMSESDYQYVEQLIDAVESVNANPPIIGQNGNWWIWSTTDEAYVDSGVDASITITVGTTSTLPAGSNATVTNTGTNTDPIFNFGIPKGPKGDKGDKGDSGVLPSGGTQGQVLTKNSSTEGDASWQTPTASGDMLKSVYDPNDDGIIGIAQGGTGNSDGFIRTGKKSNTSVGYKATIEGEDNEASGWCSHAEGSDSRATANNTHAEGGSKATASYAHAEGYSEANGQYSHAEGDSTIAGYACQHVQGKYNSNKSTTLFEIGYGTAVSRSNAFEVYQNGSISQDNGSTKFRFTNDGTSDGYYDASGTFHAFGSGGVVDLTSDVTGILPVANGGLGNSTGYVRAGLKSGTTAGSQATAEGSSTTASGTCSHAEGYNTTANKEEAHAEGLSSTASGNYSHAEGYVTTASAAATHAEGYMTYATASYGHVEGYMSTASGSGAHAEGSNTTASGLFSHSEGYRTTAGDLNHAQGHLNKTMTAGAVNTTDGDAIAIGNGTTTASNAFRVTYAGAVYGLSSYHSSGADYAEFFEWEDGNVDNEDRVGYFVTLSDNKIKIANSGDYILGIISGQPSVVGNGDEDWLGRWMRDDFGRFLYDDVESENPDTGEKITSKTIRPNPEYDSTREYIERKDRPEWDYVGMIGALAVRDDGTCEVNSYCECGTNGVATKSNTGYRVIQRISENVIKVIYR